MTNKVKVPVIMQMEAVECGATSLCMVLAYYKKWMPLPEVRTEMGVSRDGVSALHILKTARKYGLEAKGYRYQALYSYKLRFCFKGEPTALEYLNGKEFSIKKSGAASLF